MPKKNSKVLYLIALSLFLGGIAYLVISGATGAASYWVGVSEVMAMPADQPVSARVFGNVKMDGVTRPENGGVRFLLEDKDNARTTIWVSYQGAIPEAFKPGAEIIVNGTFRGPGQDFVAHTLITACPSKYEKKNRES